VDLIKELERARMIAADVLAPSHRLAVAA